MDTDIIPDGIDPMIVAAATTILSIAENGTATSSPTEAGKLQR